MYLLVKYVFGGKQGMKKENLERQLFLNCQILTSWLKQKQLFERKV